MLAVNVFNGFFLGGGKYAHNVKYMYGLTPSTENPLEEQDILGVVGLYVHCSDHAHNQVLKQGDPTLIMHQGIDEAPVSFYQTVAQYIQL